MLLRIIENKKCYPRTILIEHKCFGKVLPEHPKNLAETKLYNSLCKKKSGMDNIVKKKNSFKGSKINQPIEVFNVNLRNEDAGMR